MDSFPTNYPEIYMPCPFAGEADQGGTSGNNRSKDFSTKKSAANVNMRTGFPSVFSMSKAQNGKYLARPDMNALGYLATIGQFRKQIGCLNEYNAKFATEIGGYPKGAVLDFSTKTNSSSDGTSVDEVWKIISLKASNTTPPTASTILQFHSTVSKTETAAWMRISPDFSYIDTVTTTKVNSEATRAKGIESGLQSSKLDIETAKTRYTCGKGQSYGCLDGTARDAVGNPVRTQHTYDSARSADLNIRTKTVDGTEVKYIGPSWSDTKTGSGKSVLSEETNLAVSGHVHTNIYTKAEVDKLIEDNKGSGGESKPYASGVDQTDGHHEGSYSSVKSGSETIIKGHYHVECAANANNNMTYSSYIHDGTAYGSDENGNKKVMEVSTTTGVVWGHAHTNIYTKKEVDDLLGASGQQFASGNSQHNGYDDGTYQKKTDPKDGVIYGYGHKHKDYVANSTGSSIINEDTWMHDGTYSTAIDGSTNVVKGHKHTDYVANANSKSHGTSSDYSVHDGTAYKDVNGVKTKLHTASNNEDPSNVAYGHVHTQYVTYEDLPEGGSAYAAGSEQTGDYHNGTYSKDSSTGSTVEKGHYHNDYVSNTGNTSGVTDSTTNTNNPHNGTYRVISDGATTSYYGHKHTDYVSNADNTSNVGYIDTNNPHNGTYKQVSDGTTTSHYGHKHNDYVCNAGNSGFDGDSTDNINNPHNGTYSNVSNTVKGHKHTDYVANTSSKSHGVQSDSVHDGTAYSDEGRSTTTNAKDTALYGHVHTNLCDTASYPSNSQCQTRFANATCDSDDNPYGAVDCTSKDKNDNIVSPKDYTSDRADYSKLGVVKGHYHTNYATTEYVNDKFAENTTSDKLSSGTRVAHDGTAYDEEGNKTNDPDKAVVGHVHLNYSEGSSVVDYSVKYELFSQHCTTKGTAISKSKTVDGNALVVGIVYVGEESITLKSNAAIKWNVKVGGVVFCKGWQQSFGYTTIPHTQHIVIPNVPKGTSIAIDLTENNDGAPYGVEFYYFKYK